MGVIYEYVEAQFGQRHLHQLVGVDESALGDHLDLGVDGAEAEVLLRVQVSDADGGPQFQLIVIVCLDVELGILVGRLDQADVPDHVHAKVLMMAPGMEVEGVLILDQLFGHP